MSLLLSICVIHFIAQLSPGPDILLIAKSAASTSRQNALKVMAGISVGILLWVLLTLAGFSVLVEQWPWIQQVLMLLGGLFLLKMGWAMFHGGITARRQPASQAADVVMTYTPSKNYFLMGLFTNLSNPKTLIYFSSVFSLALSSAAAASIKLQLALIIPIQTFLTFMLLMLLLSQQKMKQLYQAAGVYIDISSGLLFIIFALWLFYDALILL